MNYLIILTVLALLAFLGGPGCGVKSGPVPYIEAYPDKDATRGTNPPEISPNRDKNN